MIGTNGNHAVLVGIMMGTIFELNESVERHIGRLPCIGMIIARLPNIGTSIVFQR